MTFILKWMACLICIMYYNRLVKLGKKGTAWSASARQMVLFHVVNIAHCNVLKDMKLLTTQLMTVYVAAADPTTIGAKNQPATLEKWDSLHYYYYYYGTVHYWKIHFYVIWTAEKCIFPLRLIYIRSTFWCFWKYLYILAATWRRLSPFRGLQLIKWWNIESQIK